MDSMPDPANPIAAVTHADPYPYYSRLAAQTPFYRDEALKLWVASSAEAVTAILTSDICRVRPVNEPVPTALLGSPAAEVFRHLIRMNDGAGHCPFNRAVAATLNSVATDRIAERAAHWSNQLLHSFPIGSDPKQINRFAFNLSAYVIGDLLGLPHAQLERTSEWVGQFVRCIFPASTAAQIEQGKSAASHLMNLFQETLSLNRSTDNGLLSTLAHEAQRLGRSEKNIVLANAIGFLTQAYEATAGLIGNSMLALSSNVGLRSNISADAKLLPSLIQEILRFDPPTHNTRRFVAVDGILMGQSLNAGDAILVVVAAANRDPSVNLRADVFELRRSDRRLFTFGTGVHACPGTLFATTIAETGVQALLASKINFDLLRRFEYRSSANTRIPLFA